MIRKDYILSLIQDFFSKLNEVIQKKEETEPDLIPKKEPFLKLYEEYLKFEPKEAYNISIENLEKHIDANFAKEQHNVRMEMMAELLYKDALNYEHNDEERKNLADKSLTIYKLLEIAERTFSFDRNAKMSELKSIIQN